VSTPEARNEDRFRNRRKMAWQAWIFILLVGAILTVCGIMSDNVAARIERFWPAVASFVATPGLVVLAYYGSAAYEHKKEDGR
jgi:ABC-type microcin C transport system permease subunit YejE